MTTLKGFWQVLLLLLAGSGLSQQATLRDSAGEDFYTAAVVEFRQALGGESDANVADNLAGYLELINSPEAAPADIIVFPEMTLNEVPSATYVPSADKKATPCVDEKADELYVPFFVNISCAARNASKYIVININEKQLCSETPEDTRPCAPNGFNVFNTNVVFDRKGTVISKYRKIHLYLNEPKNTSFVPEPVTFETDFNVTFGHMICFDLAFYQPALMLAEQQGIRDFVYSVKWHSQLPFYTAAQVQLGWAYGADVNLLAAGASRLEYGSTGSGIYHGKKGTLVSVMKLDEGERRLYVSKVPKLERSVPTQESRALEQRPKRVRQPQPEPQSRTTKSGFVMTRDYLEQYESILLDHQEAGSVSKEVCHEKFCCHFEMEWTLLAHGTGNQPNASYRLAAYDGFRNQPNVDPNYVRNCAIFTCTGPSIDECGFMLSKDQLRVNIDRLVIEAVFPKSHEYLLVPNSVKEDLLPLEPAQFEWSTEETEEGNQVKVRFALVRSESNLLSFAIFGNYFDETCTYGTGTPEEDLKCGYQPTDDGARQLHIFGFWLNVLLAVGVINCMHRT